MDIYLGLGSNMGDRAANLDRALEMLDDVAGWRRIAVSGYDNTVAQGFVGPDFLNAVAVYRSDCEMNPHDVLRECKEIEKAMGRCENIEFDDRGGRIYHSRVIDIDILIFGDLRLSDGTLCIPHPRIGEREWIEKEIDEVRNSINN